MMPENDSPDVDASETANTENEEQAAVEYRMPDDSSGFKLAEQAAFWIHEVKGQDVVILDMRDRSDVCDFFVIATGLSDVQTRAIAKSVHEHLIGAGQKPTSREGADEGRWILLDYFDVVIHVQQPEVRRYYRLESLWGDAPRLEITPAWFASADVRERQPELPVREDPATTSNPNEPDQS